MLPNAVFSLGFLSFLSPGLPKAVFSLSYLTCFGFGKDFERLGGWGGGRGWLGQSISAKLVSLFFVGCCVGACCLYMGLRKSLRI